METIRLGGILVIVVLLLSLIAAAYNMIVVPQSNQEKTITDNYTLTDAQMTGINRVNLNYIGNNTGLGVDFTNQSDNLYNITIIRNNGTREPNVTYTRNGDVLDVNITLDDGEADISLGNRCTYNASINSKVGGFGVILNNNATLDNLNLTYRYFGGGMLLVRDARFNEIDINSNLGGVIMQVAADKVNSSGTINTNIQIGGVTLQLDPADNLGYKLNGTMDLGSTVFPPDQFNVLVNTSTSTQIETMKFADKPNKLVLNSNVGMGSLVINMFPIPMEMFLQNG